MLEEDIMNMMVDSQTTSGIFNELEIKCLETEEQPSPSCSLLRGLRGPITSLIRKDKCFA